MSKRRNEVAEPVAAKTQRGIQSVEVGGRLLRALADTRGPLAPSDLAASAELASGPAHAYLVSLTRLGLVKRDALSGRYEPGPLALRLGLLHLEQQSALRAAIGEARSLAQTLHCSIAVCIAGPQGPTIVRYDHAGLPLHVNLHVGTVMSLRDTATGRVFCAFLAPAELQPMWNNQSMQPALAANPQLGGAPAGAIDADPAFAGTLAAIRRHGVEHAIDAPTPGVSSVCVPVLDAHGSLHVTLTAIGASGSLDVRPNGAVVRALKLAADAITATLASPDAA